MNRISELFKQKGEAFASGFFEDPHRSKFYRFSKAYCRYYENCRLPEYDGGRLYPNGTNARSLLAVRPDYSHTYTVNYGMLKERCGDEAAETIRQEMDVIEFPPTCHKVGGYGFVHSFPNYERIEKEGLFSYRKRIEALENSDFKEGLLCLLDGIKHYHERALCLLREQKADAALIAALEKVPFSPAESLYEAVVCRNFIYYIDGCDNPGRMDFEWISFYQGEDITTLLEEFFSHVDVNNGWSSAIGPDYNELTLQILKACKGKRRPSVELRVTKEMPREIWEAAIEAVRAGGGSPGFYNEELYQKSLSEALPHAPKEDLLRFNGGGCTETMLAGVSRVGSLDAGLNTTLVLRQTMEQSLCKSKTFDDFYQTLSEALQDAAKDTAEKVNFIYTQRMKECPHPVRTLLIDDCIDNQKDFNAGGARYNWSVINLAGTVNVIDSLLAIRELIYETGEYTAEEFMTLLDKEDETFFHRLNQCKCYGVDDEKADALAEQFSERVFHLFDACRPVFGTCFMTSSIQFMTYAEAGKEVGATPDGRRSGAPLCDSLIAVHGKDNKGPTAALNSISKLKLSQALGTPVVNLTLDPRHIQALKPLIIGFFEKGGMQVQITCVSKEELQDALSHPENHRNLIVRVGGYSEYFNRLPEELKQAVIDRTFHR